MSQLLSREIDPDDCLGPQFGGPDAPLTATAPQFDVLRSLDRVEDLGLAATGGVRCERGRSRWQLSLGSVSVPQRLEVVAPLVPQTPILSSVFGHYPFSNRTSY